jgi:hypothetical protein
LAMVASLEKNPGEPVIGLPVCELILGLQSGLFALFIVCFFLLTKFHKLLAALPRSRSPSSRDLYEQEVKTDADI